MKLSIIEFVLFLSLLTHTLNHEMKIEKLDEEIVHGKISTFIPVRFPFQKIFSANTSFPEDMKYVKVLEPKIDILQSKVLSLPTHDTYNILQELRSRKTSHFRQIIAFKEYIMIYLLPNIIISLRETANAFVIEQKYGIENLTSQMSVKMFRFNQNSAILHVKDQKTLYILKLHEHTKFQVDTLVKLAHLHPISESKFITAEFEDGISIYEIQSSQIQRVNHFSIEDLETKGGSIQDIQYLPQENKIYVLDSKSGIYIYKFDPQNHTLSDKKTVAEVSGCQSMDHISDELFVLTCSLTFPNFILEIQKVTDPTTNTDAYVKKNPVYSTCFFDDLIVNGNYSIAFQASQLDIFWNSLNTGLTQTQHVVEDIDLLGLESFHIVDDALYAIESGILVKYLLRQVNGGVYIFSQKPINKEITLTVPGPCQKLSITANVEIEPIDCYFEKKIKLSISQISGEEHQKTSASAGIIIIIIMVTLLLICICLKKYRGLEEHARKILIAFKKRDRENEKLSL